jgi:hypothetical protein
LRTALDLCVLGLAAGFVALIIGSMSPQNTWFGGLLAIVMTSYDASLLCFAVLYLDVNRRLYARQMKVLAVAQSPLLHKPEVSDASI